MRSYGTTVKCCAIPRRRPPPPRASIVAIMAALFVNNAQTAIPDTTGPLDGEEAVSSFVKSQKNRRHIDLRRFMSRALVGTTGVDRRVAHQLLTGRCHSRLPHTPKNVEGSFARRGFRYPGVILVVRAGNVERGMDRGKGRHEGGLDRFEQEVRDVRKETPGPRRPGVGSIAGCRASRSDHVADELQLGGLFRG